MAAAEPFHPDASWKGNCGGGTTTTDTETEEEDLESDFYFSHQRPGKLFPLPPMPVPPLPLPSSSSTAAAMRTPDTSFHAFDDSNSVDTTPRIGKKTRKVETATPRSGECVLQAASVEQQDSLLFPSTFPSEEFLTEVSQQLEKHSPFGTPSQQEVEESGGRRNPTNSLEFRVPGFDSPSLESLTLNPFPNDGGPIEGVDSFGTTSTATDSRGPAAIFQQNAPSPFKQVMMMPTTPDRATSGMCGGISPIPIRSGNRGGGAGGEAVFDPFHFGSDAGGGTNVDASNSIQEMWADRAHQAMAKVTASESNDECDDDNVKGNESGPPNDRRLFSKDLFTQDAGKNPSSGPSKSSPSSKVQKPSLYSSSKNPEDGGADEVPSLEWSFTSSGSASASSRAASRAGQFLSQVVGRCYACNEDDGPNLSGGVDTSRRVNPNPNQQHAHFLQQLQDVKEKSASMAEEAMRTMLAMFGDNVPSFVVTMTSPSRGGRNKRGGRAAGRRHRRFPSGSTFDYSESQNPTTTGEMSHYTTSDGEGTSFDDDYYDDEDFDDEEEETYEDYDDDDDDVTRSSTRGGSVGAEGTSSVGAGREGAVKDDDDNDDTSGDFYSPRMGGSGRSSSRARRERGRKMNANRSRHSEAASPSSFNAATASPSSSSWMHDPLVKVNQGVHKLFGDAAALALRHTAATTTATEAPHSTGRHASGRSDRRHRRQDEMERAAAANDRFAC